MRYKNRIRVYVHLVWATRDRLALITDEIERDLFRYIQTVCHEDGCDPLAVGGMLDHVHLLVRLSNTVSMADLMQHIKGGSSRFVSSQLRSGKRFEWQRGYGAFSVSAHDREAVMGYIRDQKTRHAAGRLWPEAEKTSEDMPDGVGNGAVGGKNGEEDGSAGG